MVAMMMGKPMKPQLDSMDRLVSTARRWCSSLAKRRKEITPATPMVTQASTNTQMISTISSGLAGVCSR